MNASKLLILVLGTGMALVADDRANRPLTVTHTDRYNVPAPVSIRIENSFGEIDLDGWDLPEVEVTVTKSAEDLTDQKDRAKTRLDAVQVDVKHNEGDTTISTVYPKLTGMSHMFGRRGDVNISYRIHAPRGAKLIVDHNRGGLYVAGITGDIHATVDRGQITLVVAGGPYALDAQCKIGKVYSDFEGHDQRRHLVGDAFDHAGPASNLYLRTAFGDILILKPNVTARAE
jgi:hypothetical protein